MADLWTKVPRLRTDFNMGSLINVSLCSTMHAHNLISLHKHLFQTSYTTIITTTILTFHTGVSVLSSGKLSKDNIILDKVTAA
jgi:hypothetical protein